MLFIEIMGLTPNALTPQEAEALATDLHDSLTHSFNRDVDGVATVINTTRHEQLSEANGPT